VIVLFLAYGNVLVGSSSASSDRRGQDAIATATESFKREIETLKEALEVMEARHDTLEAATEQFRIKTKTIQKKLETEKAQYDSLGAAKAAGEEFLRGDIDDLNERLQESERRAASLQMSLEASHADKKESDIQLEEANARSDSLESTKVDAEQSLRGEINKLNKLLQETESRASLLEKSLEIALVGEKEKDSLHQEEVRNRIEAANRWEERMRDVVAENKNVASMIKQRDDELAGAKSTYFELRQELFDANERLREIETKAESAFATLLWSSLQAVRDLVNHEVLPLIAGKPTELLNFAREQGSDTLDHFTKMTSTLIEALEPRTTKFIRTVKETLTRLVTSSPLEELSQRYQKLHQSVTEVLKPFSASGPFEDLFKRYQKAHQDVVTGYQKAHQDVVTGYQKVHRGAIDWLESVGTVISSYCILQEGPDTNSWIYASSLFVKAHSESIIILAGILFALVCIDFAITACLSRSRSQPVKTKQVSSTSLLRKAKNLPRPPSPSRPPSA
jgi:DNA repair exonuclease SbcCD ATPase subunit